MSNRRRPARGNRYRTSFLHSRQWFARRDRWFEEENQRLGQWGCVVCQTSASKRDLELHHLDYRGVTETATGWLATEEHNDLVSCHRRCHSLIHRLIDRDLVLRKLRTRRAATLIAIRRLRLKIADTRKVNHD